MTRFRSPLVAIEGSTREANRRSTACRYPGASDISIRGLTIDTSETCINSEQFHAIEIDTGIGTGPAENVRIDHVVFNHPGSADGTRKADCVGMISNAVPFAA